jgi:hypothetical protein
MVSGLYRQSGKRLRVLALADIIAHMTQLYGTSIVIVHAMGVGNEPCAFLSILPTTPGNNSVVLVIHCVRQFIQPATHGMAATNDPLNNRTSAFIGDCFPPQLPAIDGTVNGVGGIWPTNRHASS